MRAWHTLAAVAAAVLVAGCGSGGGSGGSGASNATPAASPTTPAASPTASDPTTSPPSACTGGVDVAGWSVQRRAATLITLPVLNFDLAAVHAELVAGAGGVLFLGSDPAPADLAKQIRTAVAMAPAPGHPLVMADQEGGGIQRLRGAIPDLPWPSELAASNTVAQVRAKAEAWGRAMAALGVTMDLAPVLDVDARPGPSTDNPDGKRAFSGDAATVSRYGVAFMQGLRDGGVIPVVKHFPGLGGTTGNTDARPAPTKPIATLRAGDLTPFRDAIAVGAPAVMIANATVPGLTTHPAGLSSAVIGTLLRAQLGFTGLVVTDSLSAGAVTAVTKNLGEAAADAVESGADLLLFGDTSSASHRAALSGPAVQESFDQIVAALRAGLDSGALHPDRLDDAVRNVLRARGASVC
jgi:beta-N-acetylhexosaminidase